MCWLDLVPVFVVVVVVVGTRRKVLVRKSAISRETVS
jgi:hypothetical protein